jgi:SAM-dependent methyltransferase
LPPEATDPARDPTAIGATTPNAGWGDVDYQGHGQDYATQRRADPRIASQVHRALASARTVLNVGAGSGSYEPADRYVLAVEPSPAMRAQRPVHLAPAIDAVAEHLPLDDRSVDAAMATLTVHQWSDPAAGLAELRRVAHGPVVILTFDPEALDRFWLAHYAPELIQVERHRYPPIEAIRSALGDHTEVRPIPVPIDCRDGFTEAYYARPDRFLDPAVRRAQSAWSFVDPGAERRFVAALGADLTSGTWDRRYGAWRSPPQFDGSLRLIVGHRPTRDAAGLEQGRYWTCPRSS